MELQFHEYANIFPMMPEAELAYIVDDMKANGYDQSMPIILYQGKILDGRNRYRAADLAGVTPSFVDFDGSEPLAYVIRHNLYRRHLNESQRAVVAGRLATMRQGERTDLEPSANLPKVSQSEAAEMLNVSERTVRTVKAVERQAPQLIPLIEAGEITANEAIKEIKKEKREADIQQQRNEIEKGVEQLSGKYNVISIDDKSGDIHYQEIGKLEKAFKISNDKIICWPLDCMIHFGKITPNQIEELSKYDTRNYIYLPA